jgi:hypothetical protein
VCIMSASMIVSGFAAKTTTPAHEHM